MRSARLPSRLGPCPNGHQIQSGSKFCVVCGHTAGSHRFIAAESEGEIGWFVYPAEGGDPVSECLTDTEARWEARRMNKEALSADILR